MCVLTLNSSLMGYFIISGEFVRTGVAAIVYVYSCCPCNFLNRLRKPTKKESQ
jgi:hypothetical protein